MDCDSYFIHIWYIEPLLLTSSWLYYLVDYLPFARLYMLLILLFFTEVVVFHSCLIIY